MAIPVNQQPHVKAKAVPQAATVNNVMSLSSRLHISLLRLVMAVMAVCNAYMYWTYKEELLQLQALHPAFTLVRGVEVRAFMLAAAIRGTFALFPSRRSARFVCLWQCVEIAFYIKTYQDIQTQPVIDLMKLAFYLVPQMQQQIAQVIIANCVLLAWAAYVWYAIPETWGRMRVKKTVSSN
jgi:hypothetical protein